MQTSDESFDYTQRAFNFLESVRNADQTFNETNDDSYIFPRDSLTVPQNEREIFDLKSHAIQIGSLRRETYEVNKVWDDDYENDDLED